MENINTELKQAGLKYAGKDITLAPKVITKVTPVMMLLSVKENMYFVKEEVKDIVGYEGQYAITTLGRLCSYSKSKNKVRWFSFDRTTNYIRLGLGKGENRTYYHQHRLVAEAYIDNPENKPQVNHINCNKYDNRKQNLEWVTWKENWEHARDHGLYKGIMLDEQNKLELYKLYCTSKYTQKELAKLFNISTSSVYRHINRVKTRIRS